VRPLSVAAARISESSGEPFVKGHAAEGLAMFGSVGSGFRVNNPATAA